MAIFTFADARTQLKARVGHRTDVTDTQIDQFLNQAQLMLATNVKGIDIFDKPAGPFTMSQNAAAIFIGAGGFNLQDVWAMESVRNETIHQNMTRGSWNELTRFTQIPVGPQTRWTRRYGAIWFFSQQPTLTSLTIRYRRLPVLGTLEIPDEWFEHLLNVASIYLYPTIGRNKDRDVLFQRLPQNLQLAVTNPMTPSMWESINDEGMSIYAER